MKRKVNLLITLILLSVAFSSCGVMFGGSKYTGTIHVRDHPDTEIYVNGMRQGKGSSIGLYPRNKPLTIQLKQDGCETKEVTYNNAFRGGNFALSLISWGLVGIAVDLGTGASYKPDHRNSPDIERTDIKNFVYNVDYSECPVSVSSSN